MNIFASTSTSISAGNSTDGVGNNSITRHSPYSPLPVYNNQTSYGSTYNNDNGSFYLRKMYQSTSTFPQKAFSTSPVKPPKIIDKTFKRIADQITEQSSKVNSIAPRQLNNPLSFCDDFFVAPAVSRTPNPTSKTSPNNQVWLEKRNKNQMSQKFLRGDYIPSVNQMHLYGRRERPSRFESIGLWISRNKIS
ncbi:unnamed protein product [Blepharisma stoltei]|uniref:Uncharacterized protein n=1 Tax=Blepharisma stoltei TaxID=1481888 RepID=A0AAU9IGA0_9CILI|nr:unnamed protein product [Blepharisma stoltei]